MKKFTIALAALAISGCSGSRADGELDPGKWKQTATIKSIDAPGAPEPVQKFMQAMVGKVTTGERCMTPEQAKAGVKTIANGMQKGDCSAADFKVADGKISGKMTCKAAGKDAVMTFDGTYEPTKINMTVAMETYHPAVPSGKAVIHLESSAERVGDCAK